MCPLLLAVSTIYPLLLAHCNFSAHLTTSFDALSTHSTTPQSFHVTHGRCTQVIVPGVQAPLVGNH